MARQTDVGTSETFWSDLDRRHAVNAAGRLRLAPYARLDTRAQRTLLVSHHSVTLFAEVLNALNRRNRGVAEGFIQPVTGEAVGFSRPLLPRRVSIGIEVRLSP